MNKEEIFNYVKKWLKQKEIKRHFFKNRNIKITEEDLYKLCYDLVKLIEDNIE